MRRVLVSCAWPLSALRGRDAGTDRRTTMSYIAADAYGAIAEGDPATEPVTAYSMLWLGGAGLSRGRLEHLEHQPFCARLVRLPLPFAPERVPEHLDLFLLGVRSGPSAVLPSLVQDLRHWPVSALTPRQQEARAVGADRPGAQRCRSRGDGDATLA